MNPNPKPTPPLMQWHSCPVLLQEKFFGAQQLYCFLMRERIFSWSFGHSFNRNLVLNQRNTWHINGSKMKNQSTGKTSISFCKAFNSCLTFAFLIHFDDSGVLYFHCNREITSFLVTFVTRLPSSLCCFCSRFNCPPPLHAEPLPPNTTFSRNLQKSKQENSYQASTGPKKAEPRPRGANPRGFWSASG